MQILCFYPAMTAGDMEKLRHSAGESEVVEVKKVEDALKFAPQCDAVLGSLPEEVFSACESLKWFQSASAGLDVVLFPALVASDVHVTNTAGLYAQAGAEQAWALLLALARGLQESMSGFTQRKWAPFPVYTVSGSSVLVLGMGGFGQEFVKRAAGYDLEILALDPVKTSHAGVSEILSASQQNLHRLLPQVDAVVCACPLTPETYHLIGAEELAMMRTTAYLINVSRGGIIEEDALSVALQTGEIAGAGLDVAENEPLPADSPLWEAPHIILTPHRAGFSQDRHRNVVEFFCANVRRFVTGEPLQNVVDKKLGY